MTLSSACESIEWLMEAIQALPSDSPVSHGTPVYNQYPTQKAHWLGWLNPAAGTGSYPRRAGVGRDAKYVYNHIVEPNLLLWLVAASGVNPDLVALAGASAEAAKSMPSKAAAVRRHIPWATVYDALQRRTQATVVQPDVVPEQEIKTPAV